MTLKLCLLEGQQRTFNMRVFHYFKLTNSKEKNLEQLKLYKNKPTNRNTKITNVLVYLDEN